MKRDLTSVPKDQLLAELTALYEESKPKNDALVDVSMRVQEIVSEVYRRVLVKRLPDVPIVSASVAATLSTTMIPRIGIPKILQRIEALESEKLKIVRIEFEESLGEFRIYVDPTPAKPATP